jgi:hypothetical protein
LPDLDAIHVEEIATALADHTDYDEVEFVDLDGVLTVEIDVAGPEVNLGRARMD